MTAQSVFLFLKHAGWFWKEVYFKHFKVQAVDSSNVKKSTGKTIWEQTVVRHHGHQLNKSIFSNWQMSTNSCTCTVKQATHCFCMLLTTADMAARTSTAEYVHTVLRFALWSAGKINCNQRQHYHVNSVMTALLTDLLCNKWLDFIAWVRRDLASNSTHYRSLWRSLRARWLNQQCQSTDGSQLAMEIRLQSHQDHSTMLQYRCKTTASGLYKSFTQNAKI